VNTETALDKNSTLEFEGRLATAAHNAAAAAAAVAAAAPHVCRVCLTAARAGLADSCGLLAAEMLSRCRGPRQMLQQSCAPGWSRYGGHCYEPMYTTAVGACCPAGALLGALVSSLIITTDARRCSC